MSNDFKLATAYVEFASKDSGAVETAVKKIKTELEGIEPAAEKAGNMIESMSGALGVGIGVAGLAAA